MHNECILLLFESLHTSFFTVFPYRSFSLLLCTNNLYFFFKSLLKTVGILFYLGFLRIFSQLLQEFQGYLCHKVLRSYKTKHIHSHIQCCLFWKETGWKNLHLWQHLSCREAKAKVIASGKNTAFVQGSLSTLTQFLMIFTRNKDYCESKLVL